MKSSRLNKPQFIVGLILVAISALMLLSGKGNYSTAGVAGIGAVGVISIATSGRR